MNNCCANCDYCSKKDYGSLGSEYRCELSCLSIDDPFSDICGSYNSKEEETHE